MLIVLKIGWGHAITDLDALKAMQSTELIATNVKSASFRSMLCCSTGNIYILIVDTYTEDYKDSKAKKASQLKKPSWDLILQLFPNVEK